MKIYLHIGLHKTATTFFQYHVFPLFDPEEISYNPPRLMELVNRIFTAATPSGEEKSGLIEAAKGIVKEMAADGTQKLLVSEEDFSQRFALFNFAENQALLKRIFPEAIIILFFRFQPDWLLSAYKQKVKHFPDLDIAAFLQASAGGPQASRAAVSVDPYALDFSRVLDLYNRSYGAENVKTFFYEDFLDDNRGVTDRLTALLGVRNQTKIYRKVYKGDSALIITMRIFFRKLMKQIGRDPIYSRKLDKGRELPSLARARRELSTPAFLVVVARKAVGRVSGIVKTSSWLDWDLLRKNGMRAKLETHYRGINQELPNHVGDTRIPAKYLPPE